MLKTKLLMLKVQLYLWLFSIIINIVKLLQMIGDGIDDTLSKDFEKIKNR